VLKKLTAAGVLAAAASGVMLLAAPAPANAGTNGRGGVLSGNQVIIPISIPISACGNSAGVLGIAGSGCRGGASTGEGHGGY
jgi:predicted dinucleotide-binding enzyme